MKKDTHQFIQGYKGLGAFGLDRKTDEETLNEVSQFSLGSSTTGMSDTFWALIYVNGSWTAVARLV